MNKNIAEPLMTVTEDSVSGTHGYTFVFDTLSITDEDTSEDPFPFCFIIIEDFFSTLSRCLVILEDFSTLIFSSMVEMDFFSILCDSKNTAGVFCKELCGTN